MRNLTKQQQVEADYIENVIGVPNRKAEFAAQLLAPHTAMQHAFADAAIRNPDSDIVKIENNVESMETVQ